MTGNAAYVFDANVLVSAAILSGSTSRRALDAARGQGIVLLSDNGGATCIISGDGDLLVLDPFQGIPIRTPGAFLVSQSPPQQP